VVGHVEPNYLLIVHVMPKWVPPEDTMSRKYTAGPDIYLDHEVILDKRGHRITEQRAQKIAEQTHRQVAAGRPSLTAPGRRSPEVKARVPAELRDRLKQEAVSRGTTTSELVREALTQYLAS